MKTEIQTLLIAISFLIQSCQKTPQKVAVKEIITNDTARKTASANQVADETKLLIDPQETEILYPKNGNKATDFIPAKGNYTIQYETKGDLNKDGKSDIVLVLYNKENKLSERPMLILLQNKDASFRLDKLSKITFPVEYNEFDSKLFDTENIAINEGELNINLYSIGPGGNNFSSFKYIKNDFVLTYIEGYFRGAGGSSAVI